MGLDTVELVIEVEESFGISIEDADAEQMRTAGDLHEYVLGKVASAHTKIGTESKVCVTSRAFYALRKAVMDLSLASRRDLRPGTDLSGVIPARSRRHCWRQLSEAMQLRLPDLERPEWLVKSALVVVFVTSLFVAVSLVHLGFMIAVFSVPLSLALMAVVAHHATAPLATVMPCTSVADLTRNIATTNYARLLGAASAVDGDEVWQTLRRIICDCLGVSPEEVTKTSRFVEDLGAG